MKERDIFTGALEMTDSAAREAYVKGACGSDAELYQRIVKLLKEHEANDSLLAEIPMDNLVTLADQTRPKEELGSKIGAYKLLQKIGEGGMGIVFMAEQEHPVRRRVAVKIIKLGMDTKSVVARFEAERQALALMDHPNIAKVLDAGATETGRPYFVMELVKGTPINTYCDQANLATKERLELFGQVCRAIQHAHQKGIIHRDIKPSNILVTLNEGIAHPMVIDFGIAKAVNQRLTEKTLFTNFAQMIGTPAYMSPEQAELIKFDVDTRSDIYSLGVLLYELLTGTTPHPEKELLSQGYGEMQRIIVEADPQRPSQRLSTLAGERQLAVAKRQGADLGRLAKSLRGDLDQIVMKALDKDRSRRYDTANALAEDIRRHICDEPIMATKPTIGYHLYKLYRRHKGVLATAAAVTVSLVAATIISTAAAIKAKDAQNAAERSHQKEAKLRVDAQNLAEDRRLATYVADIKAADELILKNKYQQGREILINLRPNRERNERDLRGFEWRYLWDASRDKSLHRAAISLEHSEPSFDRQFGLTISHDQTRILVSTHGRQLSLLKAPSLELIRKITLEGPPIQKPIFAADDSKLYVIIEKSPNRGEDDKHKKYTPKRPGTYSLLVYETRDWTQENRFEDILPPLFLDISGHPTAFSFKPGRDPSLNHFVRIEAGTLQPVGPLPEFNPGVTPNNYHFYAPAGVVTVRDRAPRRIPDQDEGAELRVWKVDGSGKEMKLGTFPNATPFGPSIVSAEGGFIAYLANAPGKDGNELRLYNLNTGSDVPLESSLTPTKNPWENELAFSKDSNLLAVTCSDKTIRVWDTQNGQLNGTIEGHTKTIVDLDTIGSHAICLYGNGEVRTWDLEATNQSRVNSHIIKTHIDGLDLGKINTAPGPEVMNYFNPEFLELLRSKTISGRLNVHVVLSSETDTNSENIRMSLSPHGGYLRATPLGNEITYAGDPQALQANLLETYYSATNNKDPLIRWEQPKRFTVQEYPGMKEIGRPSFISDNLLIVETEDHAELWDLKQRSQTPLSIRDVILRQGAAASLPVVAYHDGRLAFSRLSPTGGTEVALWDLAEDREVANYEPGFAVHIVQFSPNGSLLAVGSSGRTSIIDLELQTIRFELYGHKLPGHRCFSPDGRTLLTTSGLWNVATGREMVRLESELKNAGRHGIGFSGDGKSIYKARGRKRGWTEFQFLTPRSLEEIDTEIDTEIEKLISQNR